VKEEKRIWAIYRNLRHKAHLQELKKPFKSLVRLPSLPYMMKNAGNVHGTTDNGMAGIEIIEPNLITEEAVKKATKKREKELWEQPQTEGRPTVNACNDHRPATIRTDFKAKSTRTHGEKLQKGGGHKRIQPKRRRCTISEKKEGNAKPDQKGRGRKSHLTVRDSGSPTGMNATARQTAQPTVYGQ